MGTLPSITRLLEQHRNLYFDTSLYGNFCEVWFSRASNQSQALRKLICQFPDRVLFGSDVFGCRMKQPKEYSDALRASIGFVTLEAFSCAEFRKTPYFMTQAKDKYGLVVFEPTRLHGLHLHDNTDLLERMFRQNARHVLRIK